MKYLNLLFSVLCFAKFHEVIAAPSYRIIGGFNAKKYNTPYQAQLQLNGQHWCGATILHKKLLLTAAHCVSGNSPKHLTVVTGEHDLKRHEGTQQRQGVHKVFVHPRFRWEPMEHDIALMFLRKPLRFDKATKYISMATKSYYTGSAIASGWGYTNALSHTSPQILQKVVVPIVTLAKCRATYRKFKLKITPEMICAGKRGKDTCQGDSGGPLICKESGNIPVVCGVVSFGEGCGTYPGVYANVGKYRHWIKKSARRFGVYL